MTPYEAALRAQIISLRGRMEMCQQYSMNINISNVEWNLCSAQVDALEAELEKIKHEPI